MIRLNLNRFNFVSCLKNSLGKRRYNIKLWKTFTDCFNCLPIAAIVDEKIFCCHGGGFCETIATYCESYSFLQNYLLWPWTKLICHSAIC